MFSNLVELLYGVIFELLVFVLVYVLCSVYLSYLYCMYRYYTKIKYSRHAYTIYFTAESYRCNFDIIMLMFTVMSPVFTLSLLVNILNVYAHVCRYFISTSSFMFICSLMVQKCKKAHFINFSLARRVSLFRTICNFNKTKPCCVSIVYGDKCTTTKPEVKLREEGF